MSTQVRLWTDNSGNSDIDPVDGFFSRFTNWWLDASRSNQVYIHNGRIVWLNYWEGTNSSGTYVGGDFKIGVTGDPFYEEEVNGGTPDTGARITYQESGFLFL